MPREGVSGEAPEFLVPEEQRTEDMVMTGSVFEVEQTPYPGEPQILQPPTPPLRDGLEEVRPLLGERNVWHVNATATGGGVAELLFGYLRRHNALGVRTRWLVAHADDDFFVITKNLFFRLYSHPRKGEPLTVEHVKHYAQVTEAHARQALEHIEPGDLAVLHDPATLGLAPYLRRAGVLPIWQSHIGSTTSSTRKDDAWDFLGPYLDAPVDFVSTHPAYLPARLPRPAHIILPAIDEYSSKNRRLTPSTVSAILGSIGLAELDDARDSVSHRPEGWASALAEVSQICPLPPHVAVVVQISRWDETKDMAGVLAAFLEAISVRDPSVHLVLAGPDPNAIADDPGGLEVFEGIVDHLDGICDDLAARVHLVRTSGTDLEGTAFIINAIQSRATVITQKSLCEGFGLTITEGKWKAKPVVASRVGAIPAQVDHGVDGMLVDDPTDLEVFGMAVGRLLRQPKQAERIGGAARRSVEHNFLLDRQLLNYLQCYRSALRPL